MLMNPQLVRNVFRTKTGFGVIAIAVKHLESGVRCRHEHQLICASKY